MARFTQSLFYTSLDNSWQALYPPRVTDGISFESNPYLHSVQKYQIILTYKCIRRFENSQLRTAILHANWRALGTRCLWTGTQIWWDCTHRQYINWTPQWAVVLASTISHHNFCWASGTRLQGRIYKCQQRDHAKCSSHQGAVLAKWRDWPWGHLPRTNSLFCCIILQLDSTKSEPPTSGEPASWETNIDIF